MKGAQICGKVQTDVKCKKHLCYSNGWDKVQNYFFYKGVKVQ